TPDGVRGLFPTDYENYFRVRAVDKAGNEVVLTEVGTEYEVDGGTARAITQVEIPSTDGYLPLYNPGGPGHDPTPGVRYAAGSPPITQDVLTALDDPMTVTLD
ncbi:MAG: hypothetical protein K9G80_11190, partial [Candidatus Nanopelagicales bacterium]|nr:hypothetical protein [Candidatus Nanopelagicales bacterium]